MTVQSETGKAVYVADGVSVSYAVPFYFFAGHLAVYKGVSNVPLSEGTDYTVSGEGKTSGGEVIFAEAPAAGEKITIMRHVELKQLITFLEGENFPAGDYEYSLDKIIMALQELRAGLENSVSLPFGTDITPQEMYNFVLTVCEHYDAIAAVPELAEEINRTCEAVRTTLNDYYDKNEVDALIGDVKTLKYTNIQLSASSAVSDNTYADYPYRIDIPLADATSAQTPTVIFDAPEADSGNFAPVSATYDGGVRIYLKKELSEDIVIPVILLY